MGEFASHIWFANTRQTFLSVLAKSVYGDRFLIFVKKKALTHTCMRAAFNLILINSQSNIEYERNIIDNTSHHI